MTQPTPVSIRRLEAGPGAGGAIEIAWSDGVSRVYTPRLLRDACPCATCRESRVQPAAKPPLLPVLAAGCTRDSRQVAQGQASRSRRGV